MKRHHRLAAWVGLAAFAAAGAGCSNTTASATSQTPVAQAAPAAQPTPSHAPQPQAAPRNAPAPAALVPELARPGYVAHRDKSGRVWIHAAGGAELKAFLAEGPPANHVIRPAAGPGRVTLRSEEGATLDGYLAWKPGFHTQADKDGRVWVFREDSPELEAFLRDGPPAQQVIRPGAGPMGLSLKAVDAAILDEYAVAKPGFHTQADKDGRVWVFREDSPELEAFLRDGPPAQQVIRPGAGPRGLSLKAVDAEILDAYLAAQGH